MDRRRAATKAVDFVAGIAGNLETEVTRRALLDVLGLDVADPDELEAALPTSESPLVRAKVNRQLDYLAVAPGGAIYILNPQLVVLGWFDRFFLS